MRSLRTFLEGVRACELVSVVRASALALMSIGLAQTAALAQTTTYSEDFVAGVANDPGSPQVDNWEAFRDSLTAVYASITVGGSEGPDITCADPAAVAQIAANLNGDVAGTVTCAGRDWNTGVCVGSNTLAIDNAVCTCEAASAFTLRPDVDAGNAAWGGIGATCGPGFAPAGDNVDQTLTVSVTELSSVPDLSLVVAPANQSPSVNANTFIDFVLTNSSTSGATGVEVEVDLPSGLSFVSDDAGGDFNPATGIWTIGGVAPGASPRLRVIATVQPVGSYTINAQVTAANEPDPDSTPGNGFIGEDDDDTATLSPVTPPPPLFCLGRPIQPLVFADPIAESPGASIATPQVGDVFRFPNASPGVDVLVEVTAFNNGATLAGIDNDGTTTAPVGVPDNFQPTLVGPAGDVSVDFQITIVGTGTSTPGTLDFAGSAIDIDGDGGGLREYVEVSNNIVEFALNGVEPPAPATRLITQANSPPDPAASAPSAPNRIRFEAETDDTAAGIDPDEPRNIAAAFFTDVAVFEYRIGKFGDATTGRLNSLAFNCPNIDPGGNTGGSLVEEDFGDAPFDVDTNPGYGNPIHVIDSADPIVQLGTTNTAETASGNSPTASSDAGDDGVTIAGASLQGTSFLGLQTQALTIAATNASGNPGFLQAFFDWNNDGDFDDTGEQVATDVQDADGDGTITLNVTPPVNIVAGSSFARFRWSTSSVGVQDPAGDGEVEDYQINLIAPVLTIDKTAAPDQITENFATTFTITVSETAGVDTTNVVITDVVPAGFSIESIANDGVLTGSTITWTIAGPLNQSSESVSFIARADPVTANTVITNTASAVSDQVTPPVEDSVDVTVLEGPSIIIDETFPGLCTNVGGMRSGTNLFTAAANGTFGSGPGTVDDTASPNPFPGFLADPPYTYIDTGVGAGFGGAGQYSIVANQATPIFNSTGQSGIIDPENGITGRFAVVDGTTVADAAGAGATVFNEAITGLTPNTSYEFSLWFSNALDLDATNQIDPDFNLLVDGVVLTTTGPIAETSEVTWRRIGGVFNSGARTSVTLRLEALSLSGSGNDFLLDNILLSPCILPGAELEAAKTVTVFDPLAEGLFALPGNDVTYVITVMNTGPGPADDDSLFLVDRLPSEVIFFNGDEDGPGPGTDPVNFSEIVPTGLDPFVFANDVGFSDSTGAPASFADCTYTPLVGFDPAVTFICFNPKGVIASGDPNPSFSLSFRARIR